MCAREKSALRSQYEKDIKKKKKLFGWKKYACALIRDYSTIEKKSRDYIQCLLYSVPTWMTFFRSGLS
jgi:hypothetical protein